MFLVNTKKALHFGGPFLCPEHVQELSDSYTLLFFQLFQFLFIKLSEGESVAFIDSYSVEKKIHYLKGLLHDLNYQINIDDAKKLHNGNIFLGDDKVKYC